VARQRTARRREENEVEFARIVAFSDGVFAIAITLLVLNLGVPENIKGDDLDHALWAQRQDLLAYALSFAIIGRFWIVHHRFFSSVVGFDGRLLGLNLFYLGWIALFPFSAQVFGDHADDTAAIVLYALNLAGITLVGLLMASDARRAGLARPGAGGGPGGQTTRRDRRRRLPRLDSHGVHRSAHRAVALAGALPRPRRPPRPSPPRRLAGSLSRVRR
jgi:uncharacterized membrane protein